ncbi:TolC family protein [Xanthocytophaga agilis]|uniref:TolC family protein n=1 Tax=Xanthocytophaga agilis TaxID=3048010 RepID=A0AAE3QYS5_9BACT|nr:TolC family protein [Xanthocytophaga agilis]MDJ1500591.1 TolC family protein [Xanthocytophaga agilis]
MTHFSVILKVKNSLCLYIILAICVFPSLAIAQEALTLQQAVDIALQNNYSIKVIRNQQRIAENDYTIGNAGYLPVVNGTLQTSNTYNGFYKQEQYRTAQTARGDSAYTVVQEFSGLNNLGLTGGINVNWTILGGALATTYKRLEELREAGRENTEITIENTVASVTNAYFNIIQQEQRRVVLEDALKISQERLRLAKNRYEVGSGSRQEYLSAQVDYNTDQSALITQEQLVTNAKITLNQLLIRPADVAIVATDTMLVNTNLNIIELRSAVERQNPSLLLAQRNKNIAYLDAKLVRAQRLPLVNVFTGITGNYQNSRASVVPNLTRSMYVNYGATATIPIFNGNNLNRQAQNARITQQNAEFQFEDLKTQVLADLQVAYVNYSNSLRLIELERQNVAVAQQNVTIALERYKTGVTTSLEVRDVQRNAVAAGSRLIDAIYNAKLGEIELMRLSSQIVQ